MAIKEKTHTIKGIVHQNTKEKCVICTGKAPGVIGYKTGGKW
jgi:hypothetical protein